MDPSDDLNRLNPSSIAIPGQGRMASESGGDEDVLLLVHQLPLDIEGDHVRHLLPPLHTGGDSPPPAHPFRPPPPLQAITSAEPRLSFRGWLGAPRHWELWVAKLRPIHADLWRRLGIHDAVLASTCRFRRDASALLHLASFWCPDTNTFAFPWGEATVTLHDIALLAGFPAHGAPVPAPLAPEWRPDEAALNGVRLGFNRSACKKAHHSAWVKHYLTDDHVVSLEHEHAAFLALWLTRFVLPGHPESTMRQSLFPIAVRLARGERLALGPAVLASLYRDLRDIKAFLVAAAAAATGNADMLSSLSLYSPLYILQLWMWDHFPTLRPGRENPLMDGDPMAARWHDLSRKINPTLIREALSSADGFLWQPYPCSMHTTGWVRSSDLAGNDDLRTIAHCLHPCELVGLDCIEQYLPHRVARQFGLDQDMPGDVPRANQNWAIAWETYELEGKNVAFFIPQAEAGVTARYTHWWRHQLPHSDLDDAGESNAPVEWNTSKRKVKKTLAAMEAEEEKERRLKKARVSPVTSDKKRKLEELYDSKLSNWLTAARNEINDAAGGSYQRGSSLPKYDTTSDEALLPNVGTTNDDVVLLVPEKQTKNPAVMLMNDRSSTFEGSGTFIADIPSEPEGGVTTAMLQDEKILIPADASSIVTGSPEEGTAMVIELRKEASGASDTPEEITAPFTDEKEEKFATEGTGCVAGMNPSVKNMAVVMEVDGGIAVSEEVGRAAEEATEVATQSQQEVVAGAMSYSRAGGYSKVSCTMEDNNVAGGLCTDAGEMFGLDSVEVIGGRGDHQIVEKDNEENPQKAPPIEIVESAQDTTLMGSGDEGENKTDPPSVEEVIVESAQDTALMGSGNEGENKTDPPSVEEVIVESAQDTTLMGSGNEGENKTDPPSVEEVATSDSMAAALLGVSEAENSEVIKDLNLAKESEYMPMHVAEREAELGQANTPTIGITQEEHNEFCDVDPADMENHKTHSCFDTEKPVVATGVVCAEIYGAKGAENTEVKRDFSLAKKDTEDMPMEVSVGDEADHTEHKELSKVDHTEIAQPKMHSDIEKLHKTDSVECAEIDGIMRLSVRDTVGENLGIVPEIENEEVQKNRGIILGIRDEKLADVSELEHAKVEAVKGMMEENTFNMSVDVPVLENVGSGDMYLEKEDDIAGSLKEVHDVKAEVERSDRHEMDSDEPECILQEDFQVRDETPREVHSKERFLADGNLRDEPLREGDTNEKPLSGGEGLPEKHVDVPKEANKVKQAEGEGCRVAMEEEKENVSDAFGLEKAAGQGKELTEKDIHDHNEEITLVVQVDGQNESLTAVGTEKIPKQTTRAQEKEFDKDFEEDSRNSTNGEILCSSATMQVKGNQMEVSHEDMMQEQHIQNVELIDQMEPSSHTAALVVEGVHDHKTLDTHEEATLKQEHDHKTICEYREKTTLEGSNMMDSGVRPALVTQEVDEIHAAVVIQDQKIFIMDKVMEERIELITDRSGISLEEVCNAAGDGVNTFAVAVNVTDSTQKKEASNMESAADKQHHEVENVNEKRILEDASMAGSDELNSDATVLDASLAGSREGTFSTQKKEASNMESTADNQHHGVENVNEKRILEDSSMAGSDEFNSDATVLDVNMAGAREGTLYQCALGAKKEAVVPEKKDLGTADEKTKRDLADIDGRECGGVKPDESGNTFRETLLIAQAINTAGFDISSENRQKEASFGKQNITEVEGSESNQIVMEPEEALPPEPKNPVEVKQENLENETEISICRDNDEESGKDHTSAEITITPILEEQGENGNGLAKESTKSYENLASNPKNTTCLLKLGKSSIEEVKRTYNTRSMYLKDIKESLGRFRAEPVNRVQTTTIGNYPRHAVQETISVCKEIKVPLRDGARNFGRERAPELVLTSPQEETSRWRQEQYALQILEDVQNSRISEKTRMEMEIRVLKAQIASMERQVMNLDHFAEVKSRSKRH